MASSGSSSLSRSLLLYMKKGSVMSRDRGLTPGDSPHDFSHTREEVNVSALTNRVHFESYTEKTYERAYFGDWIMALPVPAVVLIVMMLCLSLIFFGHREGQRWRDFKTPE